MNAIVVHGPLVQDDGAVEIMARAGIEVHPRLRPTLGRGHSKSAKGAGGRDRPRTRTPTRIHFADVVAVRSDDLGRAVGNDRIAELVTVGTLGARSFACSVQELPLQ
ncbi:MAG: hypothetical protein U0167_14165 [bacterium]